jgi:hypothetical protein
LSIPLSILHVILFKQAPLTEFFCAFNVFLMLATCSAHHNFLDFTLLIVLHIFFFLRCGHTQFHCPWTVSGSGNFPVPSYLYAVHISFISFWMAAWILSLDRYTKLGP